MGAAAELEIGHVRISDEIVYERTGDVFPSPENDTIYNPTKASDKDFISFCEEVRANGITDPLIITRDKFIASGHRRHAAARAIGLPEVPCRIADVLREDARFIPFLRACNRQRVKQFDEILREEIVSANPEESHRVLREYRERMSRVESSDIIEIRGMKQRAAISDAKIPFLTAIVTILENRREYWPLTDRLVHYALLNDPPLVHASKPESTYRNTQQCYKSCCELIGRARLAGRIPWGAIHDPTRSVVTWDVHREPSTFVRDELDRFLKGYYRDLMQSQPNQIEIVGEKNTIATLIRPVAAEFTIPLTIGRGYASFGPRKEMANRFFASGKKKLIIISLSDFDPEGQDIGHAFARSMRDDFEIEEIVPVKAILTATQVKQLNLPPMMKAKETSSRYQRFVDEHGDDVFELEAVEPETMQNILRDVIGGLIDVDAYNYEVLKEKEDAAFLEGVRAKYHKAIVGGGGNQ